MEETSSKRGCVRTKIIKRQKLNKYFTGPKLVKNIPHVNTYRISSFDRNKKGVHRIPTSC